MHAHARMQVALKCADLGHLASPRTVHRKWVHLLEEVRCGDVAAGFRNYLGYRNADYFADYFADYSLNPKP